MLGKTISPNEAIQAARLRYDDKGFIEIIIEDSDVAKDDAAGNLTMDLKTLRIGKNEQGYAKDTQNSVRRTVVTVLPIDSTIEDLAQFMRE